MQEINDLELQIRHYKSKDYQFLIDLYKEGDLFEEEIDNENVIKQKIKRDPESIIVALKNNEIVGTVSIMEDGKFAFIFRLVVSVKERNQGIGTKLISEAEKILKKRGNLYVNIIVNEKDHKLQEYYQKFLYKKGRVWRWMWKELK
jgi:ribosomal protein S18 acetylase RimI-like enzyme